MELRETITRIGDHEIHLRSIAGINTTIIFPGMGMMFDIGTILPKSTKIKRVFISHGHMDHIGAIGLHISHRALAGMGRATYIVPGSIVGKVETLIHSFQGVDESELRCQILGIDDRMDMGNSYYATTFKTNHRVDSQGYIIWKNKTVLKPELKEKLQQQLITQKDIQEYRKAGMDITVLEHGAEIAYTGDTTLDGISAEAKNAKILIMEMTFVGDDVSIEKARERGHIHLYELRDNFDTFKNQYIIMTHFSPRYSIPKIFSELYKNLPPSFLEKVYLGIGDSIFKFENPVLQ
jgi:ribonuclease Z